jgi:hypothetical protein
MAVKQIKVVSGDTWDREWTHKAPNGTPIDLTGASARLQVRDANDNLIMEASTDNTRLVLGGPAGTAVMLMPKEATAVAPGSYEFDYEVTYASGRRKTYEKNVLIILKDRAHD